MKMKMKMTTRIIALAAGGLTAACTGAQDVRNEQSSATSTMSRLADDENEDGGDHEELIDLGLVPATIVEAARAAAPGIVFVSAEKELEKGAVIYSLEGTVGGQRREVEMSADGKVLELENGDEEEDD